MLYLGLAWIFVVNPPISETRNSLLLRLQDQCDIAAWDQFVAIYQPLVFRLARSRGFQEADALDIVQEVMVAISKAIHRWEFNPAKGRFRDWLFRIARNMMINFLTRRKYQSLSSSDRNALLFESCLAPDQADPEATREFELEYRRELFWVAAEKVKAQVKSTTWEAFRITAIEDLSVADAAKQLGMKEGAVLVARCRVLARMRQTVAQLEEQCDTGAWAI